MGGALTRWSISGATIVGRFHEESGSPCQDAIAQYCAIDMAVVALADGAGSAERSAQGAQTVVGTVVDFVRLEFERILKDDEAVVQELLVGSLLKQLHSMPDAEACDLAKFASTVHFVAVSGGYFVAGHLGDGVIAYEENGRTWALCHPQRGEYVNETMFVTSPGATQRLAIRRGHINGITAFALMSDGTAESLYRRRDGTMATALASMWKWLEAYPPSVVDSALQKNLREIFRQQTSDDCALCLVRRISLSFDQLQSKDAGFQMWFLECRSKRSLKSRLAILHALEEEPETISIRQIAKITSLSESSVRRHTKFLRLLRAQP